MTTYTNMNLSDYANEFILVGGGVVTTVTAWVQGQRTAKGSELDNVNKAITIWRELASDLQVKLETVEAQGEECERARKQLMAEFDAHKRDNYDKMRKLENQQKIMAEAFQNAFAAQGAKLNQKINLDLLG